MSDSTLKTVPGGFKQTEVGEKSRLIKEKEKALEIKAINHYRGDCFGPEIIGVFQ